MGKISRRLFIGILSTATAGLLSAAVSLAWFFGAAGKTDKVIDGEIGLRSYFYTGDGSREKPYEIVNPVHFYNLTRLQNLGIFPEKKYFQIGHEFEPGVLKCINSYDNEGNPIYSDYLDMGPLCASTMVLPVGGEGTPFVGTFEGNGIPVKNLVVSGYPEDIGVFGYVSFDGSVNGLVCSNLEVRSMGYSASPSHGSNKLFSVDIDDIFDEHGHYFVTDTSLSFYKHNGSAYTEIPLKHRNGVGGTAISNIDASENLIADTDIYNGCFIPTFPDSSTGPFTYSWKSSSPILKEVSLIDIDGDHVNDKGIVIDLDVLRNSNDFNSEQEMEVDARLSLIASINVDGYTFSRVIQSYTLEFYSNSHTYGEGFYSAAFFCDYLDTGLVNDRNTNYHHGNNIGFLAGHVDGSMTNSYVYDSKIVFNNTSGNTPILTESDTGLIGEIGKNVITGIDPELGLQVHGEIGVMNFSKIYSMIRSDYPKSGYPYIITSGRASPYGSGDVYNYISYQDFINEETIGVYEDYLRHNSPTSGDPEFITRTDATMNGDTYTISKDSDIKWDFNSVDFIWNKLVEDEEDVDRGLGVFKIVTSHCGSTPPFGSGSYGNYFLSSIGKCRIVNGAPKTKVYFSTAELDNTGDAGGFDSIVRATSMPSYCGINTFDYPFSRDYNYVFELNLEDMAKAGGKDYMYNTDSAFLTNYLSSKLINKYGAPVTPGSARFGFMFRSSENELLTELSSYMPVGVPDDKYQYGEDANGNPRYYPANCIAFSIENENGANVSVVGNGADISIYRNNVSSSDKATTTKLYTMKSSQVSGNDSFRYFSYDVETGATSTEVVKNAGSMNQDAGNALYGHIFKLPKGDYIIGARNDTAKIYFLAVQGQTDATIGSTEMADIGYAVDNVDFLTAEPTLNDYPSSLALASLSYTAYYDDSTSRTFYVAVKDVDGRKYVWIKFSDSPSEFVTYLMTYSAIKKIHYINEMQCTEVNTVYPRS